MRYKFEFNYIFLLILTYLFFIFLVVKIYNQINNDLDKCYKEISDVIDNSILVKKEVSYNKEFIAAHVKKLTS